MFGAGLPAAFSSRGQCSCSPFFAITRVMYRSVVCCKVNQAGRFGLPRLFVDELVTLTR